MSFGLNEPTLAYRKTAAHRVRSRDGEQLPVQTKPGLNSGTGYRTVVSVR